MDNRTEKVPVSEVSHQTVKMSAYQPSGSHTVKIKAPKKERAYLVKQGVILCFALLAALLFVAGEDFETFEAWTLDIRYVVLRGSEPRRISPNVAVVKFDDKSFHDLAERWPWKRSLHAKVIDRLAADGAAVIAFDVLFAYPSKGATTQDGALAGAIGRAGNVTMLTNAIRDGQGKITERELPLEVFRQRLAGFGYPDVLPDNRGVVRLLKLCTPDDPEDPSFALDTLRVYRKDERPWARYGKNAKGLVLRRRGAPSFVVPLADPSRSGFMHLNFRHLDGIVATSRSFSDVAEGKFPKGLFFEKIVFVGPTSRFLHDIIDTPVEKKIGGVFLHALAVDNILSGNVLRRPGLPCRLGATLLALALAAGMAAMRNRALGLVVLFLSTIAVFVTGAWALASNVYLDILPFCAGVWVYYLLFVFAIHARLEALQTAAIKDFFLAGHAANVDCAVVDQLNTMFGIELPGSIVQSDSTNLPKGMQLLASFIDEDYRNIAVLGKGGMGVVVSADDIRNNRRVAIKIMSPLISDDKEAIRRFTREIDVMTQLRHPYIVKVFRVGKGDFPYIVMELLEGDSLRAMLSRKGRLDGPTFFRIFTGVAEGLGFAHELKIIHRDIKPDNIHVHDDGNPQILDFGLAQVTDHTRLTQTGYLLGTLRYMAPEQMNLSEIVPATDIYAVGVVMLEALMGPKDFVLRFGRDGLVDPGVVALDQDVEMFRPLLEDCLKSGASARPANGHALAERLRALEDSWVTVRRSQSQVAPITPEDS